MANLVECLDKASTDYGMEISAAKTKLMANNTSGTNTEIKVNRQKLETVTSFKYLGSVITDEGSQRICRLKIYSVVLLPALKPVCSSAMIFSVCGFNLFSMIFSMTLLGWLMRLIVL